MNKSNEHVVLKENVQRGAQLLDQEYPGWAHSIQLEYLDMYSLDHCILGQLYMGFGNGLSELGLTGNEDKYYGFEREDPTQSYTPLDHHWKQEIQSRLSK